MKSLMRDPCGNSLQLQLNPGRSFWILQRALVAADGDLTVRRAAYLPSRTTAGPSTALDLCENTSSDTRSIWLAAATDSHFFALADGALDMAVRARAFLAAEDGVKIASCEPVFSACQEEPEEWLGLSGSGTAIISSNGTMYQVTIDGEYLVNVDNVICYSKSLSIAAQEPKRPPTRKMANLDLSRIYHFSGRGTVWCQPNQTAALSSLLRPYLKRNAV